MVLKNSLDTNFPHILISRSVVLSGHEIAWRQALRKDSEIPSQRPYDKQVFVK